MVGQASKGLQDYEVFAAFLRVVNDFARNQNSFSRIERVVNQAVASMRDFAKAGGALVKGMAQRDFVGPLVGHFKELVYDGHHKLFAKRTGQVVFFYLRVLGKVIFLDYVGHARLDYFKAVLF